MMDLIKGLIIIGGYFAFAPLWGFLISKHQRLEDITVGVLAFLLGMHIDTTVLMLGSVEWYRGVTKGYEFTMMEIASISLIVSALLRPGTRFKWLPAGTLLWGLYVFASSLSLISAINTGYVYMSILKFSKAWLIVYAIANYVRNERTLHVLIMGICIMLFYQWGIVMKMKFIDGFYQVRGLFEHQNPLAMFTYMASLPILSLALSPKTEPKRSVFYLSTFAAAALIVLASLSRAALAVFAVGVILVMAWGFLDRITLRRLFTVFAMAFGGVLLLAATADTIIARFNDEGNEASGETREVMNKASEAMLEANIFGVGWNNFGVAINPPYPYGDVIDQWNRDRGQKVDEDYAKGVVESHYWLLLGEGGWLSLITYALFIIVTQLRLLYAMVKYRGQILGPLAAGIFISFALTYGHSQLERVLTQTKNLALWMVLVGVVAALPAIGRSLENRSREAEPPSSGR